MAELSVLIPHKHERENDRALKVALDCLIDNTDHDYEILIDSTTPGEPYTLINRLAMQASAPWLVFSNSDVFFAPHWDTPFLAAAEPHTILTGLLVEPGAIGVAAQNMHRNFGMTPDRFYREGFETFCATYPYDVGGDGWYFPCLINRSAFLELGGFDVSQGGFPLPLDIRFWERWRGLGYQVRRVRSFAYHLQNWSNRSEQEKAVRYG